MKKGDKGGWIEKEYNLSHYGDCWVYDSAIIWDRARVCDKAIVRDSVMVGCSALICGTATICGTAMICGTARVCDSADVLTVSDIGSRCGTTTVFKCSDDTIRIKCGCFYGTVEEFEKAVEKTHGNNKFGKEYRAVIELIKVHFDLTGDEG